MGRDVIEEYERGVADSAAGRFDQAAKRLEKVVASAEIDFVRREHARMLLGYASAQREDWNRAIACFKEALLNDIECLPAHTALGHAYILSGRIPEAIEVFRMAVQKDPENSQARHGLGWALMEEGRDMNEALFQVQEALQLNPRSAAIRDSMGWVFYRMGRLEEAAEQLDEAVKIDPDHPVILAHRREVRDALRRGQERSGA
jgi:tetratricopeptide (TPR) repeat protein